MSILIDTSLWVDFSRIKSPPFLKRFINPYLYSPDAVLVEPIAFEVTRLAHFDGQPILQKLFEETPLLRTPPILWTDAADLGQRCRRAGIAAGSLDLLIAAAAIHHQLTLVTFDQDFLQLASLSTLQVNLLQKPSPA